MNQILIFDGPLMSVWVYPAQRMIHHIQKGYNHGAPFREALDKATDALQLYRATKWLSDDRATGPVPKEDEDWAQHTWFPRTKAAGWKHWAIIPPLKVIGHIKIERLGKQYSELGINTRLFTSPGEAMKWLEEQ